jgi:hypothetical protein
MDTENTSDASGSGQVQGGYGAVLRSIVQRSRADISHSIGTLRGLADGLDQSIQFGPECAADQIVGFASDIQALATRALLTASVTIAASERLNVCAQALGEVAGV